MLSAILNQFEIFKSYFNSLLRYAKNFTYKRQKVIKVLYIYQLIININLWENSLWNADIVISSKIPFAEQSIRH